MEKIIELLEMRKDLRKYLFCRGFLVTNSNPLPDAYPFYGAWVVTELGRGYRAYTHPLQKTTIVENDGRSFILCGHAYNPFTMEIDETAILTRIAEAYGSESFQDRIDELTGIFVFIVLSDQIEFQCDPSGMQSAYYGKIEERFYITSHSQLVGDLCGLHMNELTKEMLDYKWYYRVMGPYLPGDMTQFDEVKRIVPDHSFCFDGTTVTHRRIWPLHDLPAATEAVDYDLVINEGAGILKRNMDLVSRKWKKPYISLSGGIDSNTTFAAANGIYNRFKSFSFVSAKKETVDAEAAEKIADRFGMEWLLFKIPESSDELPDYNVFVQIMDHNNGHIAPKYSNENRKRIYLLQHFDGDVEVKSWVSETIRAYWYKHYGRKTMPPISPKLFRNLYKIFIFNRDLAHKIDRLFEDYISKFEYELVPDAFPPADMHYHEVTWGSWGGLNISDMKIYSDLTIIYNNRRFLELMFRVPLEKRISDQHHLDMKRVLNPDLYDMHIRVVNLKETDFRAFALNVIFTINSIMPF